MLFGFPDMRSEIRNEYGHQGQVILTGELCPGLLCSSRSQQIVFLPWDYLNV